MITLSIESRRPGKSEFGTRSRLGDINYQLRAQEITLEKALEQAYAAMCRWIDAEPMTEYKIGVHTDD